MLNNVNNENNTTKLDFAAIDKAAEKSKKVEKGRRMPDPRWEGLTFYGDAGRRGGRPGWRNRPGLAF